MKYTVAKNNFNTFCLVKISKQYFEIRINIIYLSFFIY